MALYCLTRSNSTNRGSHLLQWIIDFTQMRGIYGKNEWKGVSNVLLNPILHMPFTYDFFATCGFETVHDRKCANDL